MTQNNTYKTTEVGLIPNDWEVKRLKEVSEVIMGQSPDSNNYFNYEIGLPLIQGNADIKDKKSIKRIWTNQITKICEEGDIIMSVRAPVGSISTASYKSCIGRGVCGIKSKSNTIRNYLYFYLENYELNWVRLSQGSTFESITGDDIKSLLIPLPPLPEQQKIAEILSTWDSGSTKIKAIITELKQRKNGLAMELLSGRLRLSEKKQDSKLIKNKGFTIPNDWKVASLSKVVKQVKNSVTPEDDKLYKQIGIRSHAKGIFYKEEVTGLSLGNKSVFQIEPDCFIVNIVFAWEHAIAKTTINEVGMIASHRFPMYKPVKDELDLDYLLHFFKSKKGKELLGLASPGGAGRNKTLGQSEFLKLQIPIPDIAEQRRIAEMLDKVDAEILLYQEKLAAFQLQKKGLMQQLLTGKVRTIVKI